MVHNEELRRAVLHLYGEIVDGFRTDGVNFGSSEFLSAFPYALVRTEDSRKRDLILGAALSPAHMAEAQRAMEAFFSDSAGADVEFYLCRAVEDFLNYLIPRAAGLPDEESIFDELYSEFDESLFGKSCLVTTFAVLKNVWDHSGRAVLPDRFSLRYVDQGPPHLADGRWLRNHVVPYFEIKKSAHSIGGGRDIREDSFYFLLERSVVLPKDKDLIGSACALRDETARKFTFAVRLLNSSAALSDYRGFRTIGHLSAFHMNLMNFPDERIDQGESRELNEATGPQVGVLLTKLAGMHYDTFAVIDTKVEDAIRRTRRPVLDEHRTRMKVAIDQLLDYFQVVEAVLPVEGSENISVYSTVLLKASGNRQFIDDPLATYEFIKRMHRVRNDIMHGRVDDVLDSSKSKFSPDDARRFGQVANILATLFILNGKLRDAATKLALGEEVVLESPYKMKPQHLARPRGRGVSCPGW